MCLAKPPEAKTIAQPTKEVAVSKEDAITTALAEEKKRRGFNSTNVTQGTSLAPANIATKKLMGE